MAQKKKNDSRAKKMVNLKVSAHLLDQQPNQELPKGMAYAFSKGSKLLASGKLDRNGIANLNLPPSREAQSVRVLVGAVIDDDEVRLSKVMRLGGEGQMIRIDPGVYQVNLDFHVIPSKYLCWLLSRCHVPGTVMKRVEIDGMPVDLPVCGVTVKVYEVDPIWIIIPRLPDIYIERIRDIIVEGPIPPDGPFPPDPWPPDGPFPPPPPPPVMTFDAGDAGFGGIASKAIAGYAAEAIPRSIASAPSELAMAAKSASTGHLRDALIKYPDFAKLLLCLYTPWGVTMDLVATATTDQCGHFQAAFFRGCKNPDTPDLYFKVIQHSGPFTFTLYEPSPITCFTRWNYACGTPVSLYTTHPFARTCSPCPPIEPPEPGLNWVAVMHIGNLPLSRIRGTSVDSGIQASDSTVNQGLCFISPTEAGNAATFDGRPFGGMLRLHLEFDNSLREDLGVHYYQVSWREGDSGDFMPLIGEVHRHYSHEPTGATTPVFEVYSLGPQLVGTTPELFEIPPAMPPMGQWVVTDLAEDQTSAKFPTGHFIPEPAHGKYQLKIDLYTAGGNLVNIDTTNIIYVVPEQLDLAADAPVTTADAAALNLVTDDDGDGKKSFIMTVHVDNNDCTAAVAKAQLSLSEANDCGVLEYDPDDMGETVTMPYTAFHPNGFATYRFRLKRGITTLPFTQTGTATLPGTFSQTATVSALTGPYPALGLPACPVAAFSEALHVWALATNGWSRLHAYDAFDHAAFVLAPEEEEIVPGIVISSESE